MIIARSDQYATMISAAGSLDVADGIQRSHTNVTQCLICGGDDFCTVFPKQLPWLRQCVACGLQSVHPQPSDDELNEIYDGSYYESFGFDAQDGTAYRSMKRVGFRRQLQVAERHFGVGRLLDVGSGPGDMLFAAKQRGWDVTGIEPNAWAVDRADCVVPGSTFCGTFEEFSGSEEATKRFDLITCSDVLEHLRRPDHVLADMHDLLRPGGGLVLTTIDVRSVAARILGPRWVHYHRDHLWYFDRPTLQGLAEKAGFEVIACRRARKVFHLNYVLSILTASRNFLLAQMLARWALRCLPDWIQTRQFRLGEGLLLIARRTGKS